MTDREIMKLALEALENSVDLVVNDAYNAEQLYGNYPTRQGKVGGLKVLAEQHKQAITAIKEALAQPEQKRPQNCGTGYCSCIECVMEPEQEPVAHPFEDKAVISSLSWAAGLIEQAYRAYGGHNGADSWLMNYADKQGERIRQADHREWEKVNGRWQVKETTPPQRTWVGLTDEEITTTSKETHFEPKPVTAFARAIEAKLKEKNI